MRVPDDVQAALAKLPTFAPEQMAQANRTLIAQMRQRLATGEPVAPMYQPDRLDYLEAIAALAEQLIAQRPDR
jgi:hypothetical protein